MRLKTESRAVETQNGLGSTFLVQLNCKSPIGQGLWVILTHHISAEYQNSRTNMGGR